MKRKRSNLRWKVSLVLLLALSMGGVGVAGADTGATTTGVAITGGDLQFATDVPSSADFATVVLDGSTKEYFTHLADFSVIDARGTGDGWKVQVSATLMGGTYTFPSGSLALIKASGLTADFTGTTTSPPTVLDTGTYLPIDGQPSTSIISAETNKGMGKWTINWEGTTATKKGLRLYIDQGTVKPGTYSSTINWVLVTGP